MRRLLSILVYGSGCLYAFWFVAGVLGVSDEPATLWQPDRIALTLLPLSLALLLTFVAQWRVSYFSGRLVFGILLSALLLALTALHHDSPEHGKLLAIAHLISVLTQSWMAGRVLRATRLPRTPSVIAG